MRNVIKVASAAIIAFAVFGPVNAAGASVPSTNNSAVSPLWCGYGCHL